MKESCAICFILSFNLTDQEFCRVQTSGFQTRNKIHIRRKDVLDGVKIARIVCLFYNSFLLIVTWASWILDQSTCKEGVEEEGEEPQDSERNQMHSKTTILIASNTNQVCPTRRILLKITIIMAPLVGLVHLVANRFCPPGNPVKTILLMV